MRLKSQQDPDPHGCFSRVKELHRQNLGCRQGTRLDRLTSLQGESLLCNSGSSLPPGSVSSGCCGRISQQAFCHIQSRTFCPRELHQTKTDPTKNEAHWVTSPEASGLLSSRSSGKTTQASPGSLEGGPSAEAVGFPETGSGQVAPPHSRDEK